MNTIETKAKYDKRLSSFIERQINSNDCNFLEEFMDHNPNLKKLYDDLSKIVPATTKYQEEHKEKVLSTIKH